MVDLPDKMDLEVGDRDVEDDVVKIMESMHHIRCEFKEGPNNPEEKLKEYGHLAYRLASGMEALTSENDGLAEHLEYIVQELRNDERLLDYDPVQDGYWSKEHPDFVKTLDRVLVAVAEDRIDNFEKKHHVMQAIKYLMNQKSLTLSPYYGALKVDSLPFVTRSFFIDRKVDLGFSRIDSKTVYFHPDTVSHLKPHKSQDFLENLVKLKRVTTDFGYERIVFPQDLWNDLKRIEGELKQYSMDISANYIEEELGIILVIGQAERGNFSLADKDLIMPFKKLCKIIPDGGELYGFLFDTYKNFEDMKVEGQIVRYAKEKLLEGKYPDKEVRFHIAYRRHKDFLGEMKNRFFVRDHINFDYVAHEARYFTPHSNYFSSLSINPDDVEDESECSITESWKKIQVVDFNNVKDKKSVYIASTIFNTKLDAAYTKEEIKDILRDERPCSEKIRDIAQHNTFTRIIRIGNGEVVEDYEAMNWEDKDEQGESD